ncbi:MAG: hypothetical protein K0R54_163 [Clostridiaceae bacterium]|nr:hypothetical protein [Clostridiaceae bacterium]
MNMEKLELINVVERSLIFAVEYELDREERISDNILSFLKEKVRNMIDVTGLCINGMTQSGTLELVNMHIFDCGVISELIEKMLNNKDISYIQLTGINYVVEMNNQDKYIYDTGLDMKHILTSIEKLKDKNKILLNSDKYEITKENEVFSISINSEMINPLVFIERKITKSESNDLETELLDKLLAFKPNNDSEVSLKDMLDSDKKKEFESEIRNMIYFVKKDIAKEVNDLINNNLKTFKKALINEVNGKLFDIAD